MKSALAFDTLLYANKLKDAGMEPHLAEVQAEVTSEILSDMVINMVASKQDVIDSETRVKNELKEEIHTVRSELKEEIHTVRSTLKEDIFKLDRKIDSVIISQKELEIKLTMRMGYMLSAVVAILSALITILHVY